MPGRVLQWAGVALFVCAVAGMVRYFTRVDLGTADQAASVLGAFVGVAGLALAIHGTFAARRTGPSPPATEETVQAAKRTLGLLVAEQWRREATIRSLGDPRPIPVSWRLAGDAGLMDHPHLVGPEPLTFTASSGRIPELAESFRALSRRRLIVTGGPGSGKTTLAVQLLLELLDSATPDEPVPVLVTLNGWDTTAHPRLHDWLAVRLARDYPALTAPAFGPDVAKVLVGQGHVLPFLDGLDELPEQRRVAVIGALNGSLSDRDGLVLTSRTDELAAAVRQAGDVLTAAAVIAPRPLTPAMAVRYLRTCLPPRPRHDWEPVFAALTGGTAPALTEAASTALGLWLIRTVYVVPAADPAPLVGPPAEDTVRLRAHLLDRLIPAAIGSRPPTHDPAEHFRPRRPWAADRTRDHLVYLARLLTADDTRDLAWWHLARHTGIGRFRTGFLIGSMTAMAAWLVIGFVGRFVYGAVFGMGWLTHNVREWLLSDALFGLVFGLVFAFKIKDWSREAPGFTRFPLSGGVRLPGRPRRGFAARFFRGAAAGFAAGAIAGPVYGSASVPAYVFVSGPRAWLLFGLVLGLVFGLVSGLVYGLVSGIAGRLEAPATAGTAGTPLSSLRGDRALNLVRLVALGLVFGLLFGLAYALLPDAIPRQALGHPLGDTHRFVFGLVSTLGIALMFGSLFALAVGEHHAWVAYLIATHRLARRRLLPRGLMSFLDDAHRLGLLRTVGPIWQFRHAELQDHLASAPGDGEGDRRRFPAAFPAPGSVPFRRP
ncbi:NACHT domain-containing protein [Streptosporangium sp. NPDC051022]|uniref:NACHT domain-containing protein n=1 Tax=Streptosporangium sp. NPDC051022 TaxID=3155752 RepID=UPI003433DBA2